MSDVEITQDVFEKIVDDYIVPLFPGASRALHERVKSKGHELASLGRNDHLRLYPQFDSTYRVVLARSQYFDTDDVRLARIFLEALLNAHKKVDLSDLGKPDAKDALDYLPRRAVARAIARGNEVREKTVAFMIDALTRWAEQTYEGSRIVASFGIDGFANGTSSHITDIHSEDFIKVLSNGFDTLLTVTDCGRVSSLEPLEWPSSSKGAASPSMFAPSRLLPIARWSLGGRNSYKRVALTLNRNGDITVCENGRLKFAKRRGYWHHFAHDPVIATMSSGGGVGKTDLRHAIYDTCLDVSFARSGGCIAVVNRQNDKRLSSDKVLQDNDRLRSHGNSKSRCLAAIAESRFQELDRRVRQELVAIDGATILDSKGTIITAGAIINIDHSRRSGGGRTAAARTLGKYGLAVKISEDGAITGYGMKKGSSPIFQIGDRQVTS